MGRKGQFQKGQKAWNKGLPKEQQPLYGKRFKRTTPVWNVKPKVKIQCKACGNVFERPPSTSKTAKYCSYKCYGIAQRKSKFPISREYSRKVARATFPHKCNLCGKIWQLDVHHKDGNWRNNEVKNLEIVCKKCHAQRHKELKTW